MHFEIAGLFSAALQFNAKQRLLSVISGTNQETVVNKHVMLYVTRKIL